MSQQPQGQDGEAPRNDMRWAFEHRATGLATGFPAWRLAAVLLVLAASVVAWSVAGHAWWACGIAAGSAAAVACVAGCGGRAVAWRDPGSGLLVVARGFSVSVAAGWTCDHLPEGIHDRAYKLVQGAFLDAGIDVIVHVSKDVLAGRPGYSWVLAIVTLLDRRAGTRRGLDAARARIEAAGSRLWTGTAFPHHRFVPARPEVLAPVLLGW